ncbi:acyl-CoA desaturase [bacterium]|nr:acyl-CoA desaturase [bacterium]
MSTTIDPSRKSTRHKPSHTEPHPEQHVVLPVEQQPKLTTEDIYASFSPDRFTPKHLDWVVLAWMVAMHAACFAAPFYFTWPAFGAFCLLHWLTGSIGITMSYHRFLSHKSMKLMWPARFFGLLCGVLSGEGDPLTWAATHRLHHARSDQTGDPHSPLHGPWWSHMWWMLVYRTKDEREALFNRYAPDLVNDPMMIFFQKTFFLWQVVQGVVLYAIGGLPMLLWGLCVRMVAMYHSTWFVNSATHIWGYRSYETRDESRNLWWVAVLSYGEGWHNNHHAHPHTARAGHRWWELDPTFWAIRTLQFLGLARDVDDRNPSKEKMAIDG